jgi:hypothetical protein
MVVDAEEVRVMRKGECVMSVRNNESGNESANNFVIAKSSAVRKRIIPASKFNASFERKIERLWFQSSDFGWDYNDFVAHLLEVLIILRHRHTRRVVSGAKQKIVVS